MSFHLGLRYNRHQVSLVKVDGRQPEVLGVAYPQEAGRRARILEQWGQSGRSPRHHELATIDMPLPRRAQAILSYQVSPDVRGRLNGGVEPLVQSRRQLQPGPQERMHLGIGGARFDLNPVSRVRSSVAVGEHRSATINPAIK